MFLLHFNAYKIIIEYGETFKTGIRNDARDTFSIPITFPRLQKAYFKKYCYSLVYSIFSRSYSWIADVELCLVVYSYKAQANATA